MTSKDPAAQAGDCPDWPDDFAQRYVEAGYWSSLTFTDLLSASVRRFSSRVALVDAWERLTYQQLEERVDQLATGLVRHGVASGDNVVVQLSNRIAFAEVFFALSRLGARPVLALPAHRQLDIRRLCDISSAIAYITEDDQSGFDYRRIARDVLARSSSVRSAIIAGSAQKFVSLSDLHLPPALEGPPPASSAVACFQLSGGTTGEPKLIPRRHREYLYNVTASAKLCGFSPDTVYLAALPMAHNFPLCCPGFIGALWAGGTAVLTSDPSPEAAFPLIKKEGVTATALVPPLAMVWSDAITAYGYEGLESLRLLQVGGAKLGIEAAKRVDASFRCTLQQVFGMAEGLICYTRLDDRREQIVGTQGSPLSPADEIRIVDAEDRDLPIGAVGSLLTRGPYTIRGYYRAKEHNDAAFTSEGFYRTGDRARLTPDGYVIVEGRDKDQINRGGEKVAPEEVENLLLAHPAIVDAAVISIPDATLGERICAFVVVRDPKPTAAELKRFIREAGAAAYKIPDRIEFVDKFPETGVGKTSRKLLRRLLLEAYERGAPS
ncbi:AMP-binding protein [Bradyrhizobium sp. Leo121]|uniref:(2,3-dihydroxybenzoyl)adenylate synthase n=1 Tax=Bradyrhizobium sp. Leo121 TaxID=1571195 RepID=UPI001029F2FD|nr:AMP-binding protein [Bradyrhizobium sp. Leo121]RZN31717.1 2,3-dihydroxybenzoate-AMP ligase [Bradyrhizobium sp. Leo121]